MFNWLSNLFSPERNRLENTVPHVEAVAVHNGMYQSDPLQAMQHGSMYRQSPWVYVAVNRIAEAGALVPLRVLRLDGEQRVQVEQHPLETLLAHPNPTMSRFELFEATLGFLELTGNAYWFIAGDNAGRPAQIWPLRPDRMHIVPDPEHYVRGYIYEVDGKQIPLEAVEVVHFKRWHPGNDYYGLSALEAARLAVESDRAMARWNKNTFGQDNGVPAGIVNIQDFISDDDFERVKREWRASYGGTQRRTAFLRGGAVEWQSIGLSHTDLDFLQGRESHRDEILNIFGIPVGLVSENATEANARVAERQFIERTLWPKLVRLSQKITQQLLPFYARQHIAEFDDIRPTNIQARLNEIQTAQSVLSVNEIRERFYEMPPVTWGNVPAGAVEVVTETAASDTENSDSPTADDAFKAAQDELAQWERFALNRLGQDAIRPFEVLSVPDEVAFEVSAGLLAAPDKDSVKHIFSEARQHLLPADNA